MRGPNAPWRGLPCFGRCEVLKKSTVQFPILAIITRMVDFGSMSAKAAEIVDDFGLLDEWDEKYRFLIELGDAVAPLPNGEKTEINRVQGCTSNVWLLLNKTLANGRQIVRIQADSDARIVKGLIAVLIAVYNEQPAEDVAAFPIEKLFADLGLDKHLSRSRANGLNSMVVRIRELAKDG